MRRSTRVVAAIILVIATILVVDVWLVHGEAEQPPDLSTPGTGGPDGHSVLGANAVINPTSFFVLYGRQDQGDNNSDIWLLDATGDRKIIDDAWRPVLSPSGRYLVYDADDAGGDRHLYVRDLVQMTDTNILDVPSGSFLESYGWTPDERRVVFDLDCTIYSVLRDGGGQSHTLVYAWPTYSLGCYNDAPQVNPVDGRLVWLNWNHEPGLAVSDPNGDDPYWVTNTLQNDVYPVWSPDGQWIAFNRNWGDLYKIRPDGTDLTRLTHDADVIDNGGTWSADGSWLVWPAWDDGVGDVFAIAADGSGRMVPLGITPGWAPKWVGGAGILDFDQYRIFLPLVVRDGRAPAHTWSHAR